MPLAANYPVFLSIGGRRCLVAGAGRVGQRKLAALLEAGASNIHVFDLRPLASFDTAARTLLTAPGVAFQARPCGDADIPQSFLVFACTSSPAVNSHIARVCATYRILCNCATNPEEGNFIVPAQAKAASARIAISTGGASPMLAAQWRRELESWLIGRERMAWLMGRLRPLVLRSGAGHRDIFRALLASPLESWLANGDLEHCKAWLLAFMPDITHSQLEEIFVDFVHAFS